MSLIPIVSASLIKQLVQESHLADFSDLRLAILILQRFDSAFEEAFVVVEARTLWDAVVVFASEQSGRQRRPDRGT